jgi:hypothetical protein
MLGKIHDKAGKAGRLTGVRLILYIVCPRVRTTAPRGRPAGLISLKYRS